MNGVDPLKFPTISSYAMFVFRNKHLQSNLIGILSKEEDEFARLGFYGGRTNSLILHKKWDIQTNIQTNNPSRYGVYMDINSLYPSVQYTENLPIGHPTIIENYDGNDYELDDLIDIIKNKELYCIVECDIICPKDLYIPVLVNRSNNKLMGTLFDKQQLVYCSPELRLALTKGYSITRIYRLHMYHTNNNIFKSYIDKYIKLKEESRANGDEYRVKISKLMLCSIWGKLAQRPDLPKYSHAINEAEWNRIISDHMSNKIDIEDFYIIEDYIYYKYRNIDNGINERSNRISNVCSVNVALAGAITSYARCRLYEELDKLKDRVLYFDTDSIIYEYIENRYNMRSGLKLGEWKQEGGRIIEFISVGPKSYICKYENGEKITRCKGFKTNLIEEKHYLRLIYGKTKEIEYHTNTFKIRLNQIMSGINKKILKLSFDKRLIADTIKNNYIQTLPFGYIPVLQE